MESTSTTPTSSKYQRYHDIRCVLNDVIRRVAMACGEPNELVKLKPSKVNGFQLFHKDICGQLVQEAEDEDVPPPSLDEMSAISSDRWKNVLSVEERQAWNKKGQRLREKIDLDGDENENKCRKCGRMFQRERDLRHHERNCGTVACDSCGKDFPDMVALQRHAKAHDGNYECDVCRKVFYSNQTLKRHKATHAKEITPCSVSECSKMFKSEAIMKRHVKKDHKH